MRVDEYDDILDMWKKHLLVDTLQGYSIEIEDDIPKEFVAIALYLDSATVKSAGETTDFYEGYRKAAGDVLRLIGVEMAQDDEMRVILIKRNFVRDDKQKELMRHIWGD
ncbi:MAG: hypothetical protein ACT4NX_05445 [Deltaproteobacteria bacterium]